MQESKVLVLVCYPPQRDLTARRNFFSRPNLRKKKCFYESLSDLNVFITNCDAFSTANNVYVPVWTWLVADSSGRGNTRRQFVWQPTSGPEIHNKGSRARILTHSERRSLLCHLLIVFVFVSPWWVLVFFLLRLFGQPFVRGRAREAGKRANERRRKRWR